MSTRAFTSRIFVEGIPADWQVQDIAQHYSLVGEVAQVNLVKNNLGQPTGKALVTYKSEKSVERAIDKYNNQAVNDLITLVKPYFDKKGESLRTQPGLMKRRVYIMNVPYDCP